MTPTKLVPPQQSLLGLIETIREANDESIVQRKRSALATQAYERDHSCPCGYYSVLRGDALSNGGDHKTFHEAWERGFVMDMPGATGAMLVTAYSEGTGIEAEWSKQLVVNLDLLQQRDGGYDFSYTEGSPRAWQMRAPGVIALVALVNGRAVGVLFGGRTARWGYYANHDGKGHSRLDQFGSIPAIHTVWVAQQYRRSGVGSKLHRFFYELPKLFGREPLKPEEVAYCAPFSEGGLHLVKSFVPRQKILVSKTWENAAPDLCNEGTLLNWVVSPLFRR